MFASGRRVRCSGPRSLYRAHETAFRLCGLDARACMGTVMGDKSISFRSLFAALLALAETSVMANNTSHPLNTTFLRIAHSHMKALIEAIEADG